MVLLNEQTPFDFKARATLQECTVKLVDVASAKLDTTPRSLAWIVSGSVAILVVVVALKKKRAVAASSPEEWMDRGYTEISDN